VILNAAFYHFSPLKNPDALGNAIKEAIAKDVKGTVLLAEEGVNAFLAGAPETVEKSIATLEAILGFTFHSIKKSHSNFVPFERFKVKVKPEIVTFRVDGITPSNAPYLKPEELHDWYEKGQDFLILDTRNEYEFHLGAFENSITMKIDHFVDLAKTSLPEDWKKKKIITFCTGGIRCEKAAPYLRSLGFDAYQLEGGILGYFEKMGGAHWKGECFVFDDRVALGPDLKPTGSILCSECQWPVTMKQTHCSHCGTLCRSLSGIENKSS